MYFTKPDQTLYPANWMYNCCRILSQVAKIAENNGGRVKYNKYGKGFIVNRSIKEHIDYLTERISTWEKYCRRTGKDVSEAVKESKEKIEKLQSIDNSPLPVTHTTSISFVLNDMYYHLSFDENPFFDFYYCVTPVVNGMFSRDAVYNEFEKENWLFDCFFSHAKQADVIEAANIIYNQLLACTPCRIQRDHTRKRVPNTYNDGWHWETVYSPERKEKIDF